MSTFDSTLKVDLAGMAALLARDTLDVIEIEDAVTGEDTQWEPVTRRRGNVIAFVDPTGRNPSGYYVGHFTIHDTDTLSTTWTKANSFRGGREEFSARLNQWSSGSHPGMAQKVVRELGRLTDGWAGPDSVAPSANILRDIQLVASSLPSSTRTPDAEVDPDDGSVVLRWMQEGALRSFSLTFVGQGGVTGFYSADDSSDPAWRLKASDSIRLAIKFSADNVQTLITQ